MNKAVQAVAAAAVVTLTLVGCAENPNDAAVVGGVTISESAVAATAKALDAASPSTAATNRSSAVTTAVQALVVKKIADDNKIPLTDAARSAFIEADANLKAGAALPGLSDLINQEANVGIVVAALGTEKVLAGCNAAQVTLNPRYGTWSPELCGISGTGSLSKLAPTPKATP
jgi:hypothetical protein